MKKIGVLLSLVTVFVSSCMKDDNWVEDHKINESFEQSRGLYIVCEGNFMYGNASLSYYDIDQKRVINDVFYSTNGIPLGDVAQSMTMQGDVAHIVVNNSGKIFTINPHNFKYLGKTAGLTSPRYIQLLGEHKAYVTDMYSKSVQIVDLLGAGYSSKGIAVGSINGSINVDIKSRYHELHSTEQMIKYKHWVFTNCWSYDNKILVLDTRTDQWVDSIEVGKQPTSIILDKENKIWTVTDGGRTITPNGGENENPDLENPTLYRIDAETRKIEWTYQWKRGEFPTELCMNGAKDSLFFINKDIYAMGIHDTKPKVIIPNKSTIFYGLTVDPKTSDIYVADAIDYVQPGVVYRFTDKGSPVDTFKVGIIPGAFCFKEPMGRN